MRYALIALMLFTASVTAQESPYVGFAIGQGELDFSDWPVSNEEDTTWKGVLGIKMNENVFFEGSVGSLGEYSASWPGYADKASADYFGATASAGLILPIGRAAIHAKAGFTYWSMSTDIALELDDGSVLYGTGNDNGFDPMYGVGLTVDASDRLMLKIDYERHTNVGDGATVDFGWAGSTTIDEGEDLDVFSIGLAYRL